MEHVIDCKGLKCPQSVINTKKYFDSIAEGKAIVIVDNEVAKNNISKFAQSNGFQYLVTEKADAFYMQIKKELKSIETKTNMESFTMVISSNMLGGG